MEVTAATPKRMEDLLAKLGPERSSRAPAPGKWSANEIVIHMADCELAHAFRFRQAQAEDHFVAQPFDQDAWARAYGSYDAQSAMAVFAAVRQWNLAFLRGLPGEAFSKMLSHPERGTMTFQVLFETMAGHDLNHLVQLEAIAAS